MRLETFVRASNIDAILDWDKKVDRALRAGAMAVGAKVKISTIPGYLPLNMDQTMMSQWQNNAETLLGKESVGFTGHRTGSTDMGDISQIIPSIHPYAGGVTGIGHGADYLVQDYTKAVINPAKAMAMTIIDLLSDGASEAKAVINKSKIPHTKKSYLELMRSFSRDEEFED